MYFRNIFFAIILILILLLIFSLKNRSPFGQNQSTFSIEPGKEITRIEFTSQGKRLVLSRVSDEWLVNDRDEARRAGIIFLLGILNEMQIKSPVSPEMFEKEVTERSITPVKVRIFSQRKLIRTFQVFKTGSNIYGNIMKRSELKKPFIVYIPGYEGDIGSVFTTDELFWKPFLIFNSLPSEISRVTLENNADTSESFIIRQSNRKFSFSNMQSDVDGWDTTHVMRYISYFTRIPFENIASDIPESEKERISSEMPLFRISVIMTTGPEKVLSLWERKKNGTEEPDSDRLWAKIDKGDDIFVVRYFDIDPILKKRSYFFVQ